MRTIGAVLITSVAILMAAQAIAAALSVLFMGSLLYGFFVAPKETLSLLGVAVFAGVALLHPLAFIGLVVVLALVNAVRK